MFGHQVSHISELLLFAMEENCCAATTIILLTIAHNKPNINVCIYTGQNIKKTSVKLR